MNTRRLRLIQGMIGAALVLCAPAGCDTEDGLDEDLATDALDEDEDLEFRSLTDFFDPVGTHDVATCSTLAGWAKDGDTTAATQVHVYKGASAFNGGQIVTHAWADKFRGDLPFADKNHGFNIPTPAAFKTGCPEKVYIHAIDLDTNGDFVPGGNNLLLNLTGKTVVCGPPPPGGCGGYGDGGPGDGGLDPELPL